LVGLVKARLSERSVDGFVEGHGFRRAAGDQKIKRALAPEELSQTFYNSFFGNVIKGL